ncbi:MAG TPA: hypothetical protein VFA29_07360, partial [Candidatus Baltobacteraceae bacterium]|nr:hypothetical protein [Candidatus Baltobacteraceae bacterium]
MPGSSTAMQTRLHLSEYDGTRAIRHKKKLQRSVIKYFQTHCRESGLRAGGRLRGHVSGTATIYFEDRAVAAHYSSGMNLGRAFLTLTAFALVMNAKGHAAEVKGPPHVAVPITAQPPSLDPVADLPEWRDAPVLPLNENLQLHQPATEKTTVRILGDKNFLYVRFDAEQREPIVITQRSNNVGEGADDEVWVDLWPNDRAGFAYKFVASAAGVRYQYSSENTAFEPTWDAKAVDNAGGYSVVLKIPLAVLHISGKPRSWTAQFVRVVRATGETQVWS